MRTAAVAARQRLLLLMNGAVSAAGAGPTGGPGAFPKAAAASGNLGHRLGAKSIIGADLRRGSDREVVPSHA
jgi:hypothetical protein